MAVRFRRSKRDVNDDLFSRIVRFGKTQCLRCGGAKPLQCCHIFSRGKYNTRFDKNNAVHLCSNCHDWFDSHKIIACLVDEHKRVFSAGEESFHWLISKGYTWDSLLRLYVKSEQVCTGYSWKKKEITKQLKAELKKLEGA